MIKSSITLGGNYPKAGPKVQENIFFVLFLFGRVAEWLKAHAWKACVSFCGTAGSNPVPSSIFKTKKSMQVTEKTNTSWYLAKLDLQNNRVLNIFTKAGNYRGWKTYSVEKRFTLLSGRVEVTTFDWASDIMNTYIPWEIITIPQDIPNIFYFPEDSEMLEWFDKSWMSEKYERYYAMK